MSNEDLRALFAAALDSDAAAPPSERAALEALYAPLDEALSLVGLSAEFVEEDGEVSIDVMDEDEPIGFVFADEEAFVFAAAEPGRVQDLKDPDAGRFITRLIEALPALS
jgi:hypothetical protein